MKVLAAPDLHCWPSAYDRPGEDGTPIRLAEWEQAANALIEIAKREKVAAALFPGDLFPTARPPHQAVLSVARLFRRLEQAGVQVIAQYGNHDQPAANQPGPLDVLADLPERPHWGIRDPAWVPVGAWRVLALPWGRMVTHEPDPAVRAQLTSQMLLDAIRFLVEGIQDPVLLLAHWALAGANWSGAGVTEPAIDVLALPKQVRAVVAGHIHRPQIVQERPVLAIHTGALLRQDFGEESDERGCYVVDLDADPPSAAWHPLPAAWMRTYRFEVSSTADAAMVEVFRPEGRLDGTFARAIIRTTDEFARQIDPNVVAHALEQAGAIVAGVQVEVLRGERARTNLTETTHPEAALRAWLALRPELSEALRERVVEVARPWIAEEVTGGGADPAGA